MNASTTRRQLIGSAVALVGAGALWLRRPPRPAGAADLTARLDSAAVALEPAVRLRLVTEVGFPVQLPGELVLLDNFGDSRLFDKCRRGTGNGIIGFGQRRWFTIDGFSDDIEDSA